MIKVLIVAALEIIQEYLYNLVEKENGYKVISCIPSGNEVIKICIEKKPDFLIMYIGIQEDIDYSVIKRVKTINKNIKVMILSLGGDKKNVLLALENGADGYVINDDSINEVLTIMGNSYSKVKYIHKDNFYNAKKSIYDYEMYSEVRFTSREKEVLDLVSEGFTNHEIGANLGISVGRARNIVADLIAKCMVKNRTQLAVLAVKTNMFSLNSDNNRIYE